LKRLILAASAAAVIFAIAGCGGSAQPSGANDASVAAFVSSNLVATGAGVTTTNPNATCVQASDVTFNCVATYTNTDSTGAAQNYQATVIVTCDATGACTFPAFVGTPVN
jgi:hypothetical protein